VREDKDDPQRKNDAGYAERTSERMQRTNGWPMEFIDDPSPLWPGHVATATPQSTRLRVLICNHS